TPTPETGPRDAQASVSVGERLHSEPNETVRLTEPAPVAGRAMELVEPVGDVGVVLEVAGVARPARPPAAVEAAVRARERPEQELRDLAARIDQLRTVETAARLRERRQRQPVPGRDRLVVAERLGPLLAHVEEPALELLVQPAPQDRAAVLERLEQLAGDALVGRPGEGQALDALRVGVLRRGEAALR